MSQQYTITDKNLKLSVLSQYKNGRNRTTAIKKTANLKLRQQKLPNLNKQKEKDQKQNELSCKY